MSTKEGNAGLARTTNLWVQSIAIVVAGLWGAYVFIFQEFTKPASAPINLTTELSVRPAGVQAPASPKGARLLAIELDITASNPSARSVYLLSNYWVATGVRVAERSSDHAWVEGANAAVGERTPTGAGEHYQYTAARVIALGSLVPDAQLKPNETVSRSYVFYLPEGAYDLIDVESSLPSVSQAGAAEISWRLDAESGTVSPTVFITEAGRRRQLSPAEVANYAEHPLNLQMAVSRRQLSLWRTPDSDASPN